MANESVLPESALDVATRRAFSGIGLIFTGCALWLGTIFLPDNPCYAKSEPSLSKFCSKHCATARCGAKD